MSFRKRGASDIGNIPTLKQALRYLLMGEAARPADEATAGAGGLISTVVHFAFKNFSCAHVPKHSSLRSFPLAHLIEGLDEVA